VNSELPLVSIIIPTRPGQSDVPAVAAARLLDYPHERLEIIIARGRQPSLQRNTALAAASPARSTCCDRDSGMARPPMGSGFDF